MKRKVIDITWQLLIFIALFILSQTVLNHIYLVEWTAKNKYLYIWIFVVIYTIFNKRYSSYALTIGNIVGLVVGQLVGEYIMNQNMATITSDMSNELIYQLSYHYGAFIWMGIILFAIILGPILDYLHRRGKI